MIKAGPITLKTHLKGLIEELEASDDRIASERELQKAALDASKEAHGTEAASVRRLVSLRRKIAKDPAEARRIEEIDDQYRFLVEGGDRPAHAPEVMDELSRVLALTNTSKPPKIEAIKKALGCSQGKAHKLRSLAAARLASGARESSSSSTPREHEHLAPHDADGVVQEEVERSEGIEPVVIGLEDQSSAIELAPQRAEPTTDDASPPSVFTGERSAPAPIGGTSGGTPSDDWDAIAREQAALNEARRRRLAQVPA